VLDKIDDGGGDVEPARHMQMSIANALSSRGNRRQPRYDHSSVRIGGPPTMTPMRLHPAHLDRRSILYRTAAEKPGLSARKVRDPQNERLQGD
jgi:hypothetical protein